MVWKKGESGNPAGRSKQPKQLTEFKKSCRAAAMKNLRLVLDLMVDKKSSNSIKLRAYELICAYGFGRPSSSLDIEFKRPPSELDKASTEERIALLKAALEHETHKSKEQEQMIQLEAKVVEAEAQDGFGAE